MAVEVVEVVVVVVVVVAVAVVVVVVAGAGAEVVVVVVVVVFGYYNPYQIPKVYSELPSYTGQVRQGCPELRNP